MAVGYTRLADVYVPEITNPAIFDAALAQSKVISSGAVSVDAGMSADMTGNGILFQSPAYINIADSDIPALIPNDDPTDLGEPENIGKRTSFYHRLARNKGWAALDVVQDISGVNPMAQVAAQYGGAVAKWREVALMKMLSAITSTAVAGATLNVMFGIEAAAGQTAANRFNPDSLIDAMVAAGNDTYDGGGGWSLFLHPLTYAQMVKDDLIDTAPISGQSLTIPTYMGIKLVVTRVSPTRAGTTDGSVRTTYLVRDGAIKMGIGRAKLPTELQREAQIGNSGGGEIFWVRDVFGYDVNGFSFTGTADPLLSDAGLATVGNWTRVLDPQQIGVLALNHN
jgi:hypothetical protein